MGRRAAQRSARTAASWSSVMFPPLQTSATRLPASRSRSRSAPASGDGAGALDEVPRVLDHESRRPRELVLADEDELVEVLPEDRLRQRERRPASRALPRRSPSGPRTPRGHATTDMRPAPPPPGRRSPRTTGAAPSRRCTRPRPRSRRRSGRRPRPRPGRPRASPGMRPDAGDQLRLVTGMDVPAAVLGGEPLAVLARLVEVAAVLDDLGAERADRPPSRGSPPPDADVTRTPKSRAGVGERLAVVPGRGAISPARRSSAELRDEVHAAAHLERAGRQVVLVLDAHLRAEELRRAPRASRAACGEGEARFSPPRHARRRASGRPSSPGSPACAQATRRSASPS